jgi:hypothetical protein
MLVAMVDVRSDDNDNGEDSVWLVVVSLISEFNVEVDSVLVPREIWVEAWLTLNDTVDSVGLILVVS